MQFDISRQNKGILLIDKPTTWTSFDVVAKIRGQIRHQYRARGEQPTKKQLKVGHAGTLDPFATGLLIVLLGDSTKNADTFLKLDKVYEATIKLGESSTTGDPEGEISSVSMSKPSINDIESVLKQLTGRITQVPPKYSAIKIDGQRAYKLMRKGQDVEVPARQITIYSIEIIDYTYPNLLVRTKVSSGTYIRTLAEDIGTLLHVGAYCSQLRRTEIGEWNVENAVQGEDTFSDQA